MYIRIIHFKQVYTKPVLLFLMQAYVHIFILLFENIINLVLLLIEPGEYANLLYGELKNLFSDHLPVHTAMLISLDSPEARRHVPHDDISEESVSLANQIITVADAVITNIDQDKLLAYYGLKSDQRDDAAKIRTTMEKQKLSLIKALVKKGCALARLYVHSAKKGEGDRQSYEHLLESVTHHWQEVQKFAEPTDIKARNFEIWLLLFNNYYYLFKEAICKNKILLYLQVITLSLWHAHINNHYGRYLKLLLRYYEDNPLKEVDEKCIELANILGWEHLSRHIKTSIPSRYPPSYRSF